MFDIEAAEKHSFTTGEPLIVEGDIYGISVRFICTADKDWVVPVADISKALGIPKQTQSDVLKRGKTEFEPFLTSVRVTRTGEPGSNINFPCLTRDGITMYLMKLTPSRMSDPEIGKRISEFQIFVVKTFGEHLDYIKIPRWWLRREAAKMFYKPMTDAEHDIIVPLVPEDKSWLVYATEADMLNILVYGKTAKEAKCNQRDTGTKDQLDVLCKLQHMNEGFILAGFSFGERYDLLKNIRNGLLERGRILLPETVVELNKIPSQYVKY